MHIIAAAYYIVQEKDLQRFKEQISRLTIVSREAKKKQQ